MMIAIGADHAGFALKNTIITFLQTKEIETKDKGPSSGTSVDYPDFAKQVANEVTQQTGTLGILICGSGIGMSIAANKINGIRAALCITPEMAEMSKKHNNANVLCLSSRMVDEDTNIKIVDAWLTATFEGDRHQRRIEKIHALETKG